ncbi:MAG: AAA family ATPase, partial [Calditrichaeota bacterium]|nr:AAA family ATPase [Calditrichota bacterium]
MLTKLVIRNFKLFEDVEIELAQNVIFVGPNNAGKTSALQALALWSSGVQRWHEKREGGNLPGKRPGVTLNRRDLISLPAPAANLLWRDLHVRQSVSESGTQKTRNVQIQIEVNGTDIGNEWHTELEFEYANEESFYCRSRLGPDGKRHEVPRAAAEVRLAYLPPMSGLTALETRLDEGAIGVRIGEGRTAEVLRNLCKLVADRSPAKWRTITERMRELFGVELDEPEYISGRGEIVMTFRTQSGIRLDLSASGRGQQQTLLLLAHMAANPGAVILLDEPDAHLEILRQRQIYQLLTTTAIETGSQIIAASHSEVILNEAASRDTVIAFVGKPHRIDDRGSQVLKALKEIGFEHYMQAEEKGWVLYLEGATDLAILRAFAKTLKHPVQESLSSPFVHYVANQPKLAVDHYFGVREAVPGLKGLALYDNLGRAPIENPSLVQLMWRKNEIENYLCQEQTLLAWAKAEALKQGGDLFSGSWADIMATCIEKGVEALKFRRKSAWDDDLKSSDEFLDPLFALFYEQVGLPNLMRKTNFHTLAEFVPQSLLDPE